MRASVVVQLKCTEMIKPKTYLFEDDGVIPNNPLLPLLYYPKAIELNKTNPAKIFEVLFVSNEWNGTWRNGIYPFPHYHAEAHEVLGIYSGTAKIQLGGSKGIITEVESGDVIVIPAGVGHENLESSTNLGVVGAYPLGQAPDVQNGNPCERKWVLDSIAKVSLPSADPVYGPKGPLLSHWK